MCHSICPLGPWHTSRLCSTCTFTAGSENPNLNTRILVTLLMGPRSPSREGRTGAQGPGPGQALELRPYLSPLWPTPDNMAPAAISCGYRRLTTRPSLWAPRVSSSCASSERCLPALAHSPSSSGALPSTPPCLHKGAPCHSVPFPSTGTPERIQASGSPALPGRLRKDVVGGSHSTQVFFTNVDKMCQQT